MKTNQFSSGFSRRHSTRERLVATALTAVTFVCISCADHPATKSAVPYVKADTVRCYQQNVTSVFPGKVKAAADLDMAFKVSGTIGRMPVRQGVFVHKGDLIAVMDDRDYRTQLSATEAEYHQIRNEAERVMGLYDKQSASRSDYDKAVYGLQQIEAKYEAHRHALEDTRLYAPFDGYVDQIHFHANETVGAGIPVISLINAGLPEVEINIPASAFMRRDEFDAFFCTISLFPERHYPLSLVGIKQKANLNQLYTVVLRMQPSAYAELPMPGMTTLVTISYRNEEHVRMQVASSAVFRSDGSTCVWVYQPDQQTVSLRPIVIDTLLNDGTAIVKEGIQAGELVVTAGVHALHEGMQVRLLEPVSSTNIGGEL